ncbi:MAG: hypothetical protein L6E13_10115 [Firmicutes bacterium]|nr:hypothetical protein [Bacillota bacterium]
MHQPSGHCAWCGQALSPSGPASEKTSLCPECEAQYLADAVSGLPPGPREPYVD